MRPPALVQRGDDPRNKVYVPDNWLRRRKAWVEDARITVTPSGYNLVVELVCDGRLYWLIKGFDTAEGARTYFNTSQNNYTLDP